MFFFAVLFVIILSFLHFNYMRTMKLLIQMLDEPIPNWLTQDAQELVYKKRQCRDFATTCAKSIFLKCGTGYPSFIKFESMLQEQKYPACDIIVGITSGGWVIAQILSRFLNKPFAKLTYSRYNNKSLYQKAKIYLGTNKNQKNSCGKIKLEPSIEPGKVLLLVDDSVGSGGTMQNCKKYLQDEIKATHVHTFAVCAANPNPAFVDQYIFANHFVILPFGLDV
jgi:hypoxanthine phosphoribosyltransferase